MPAMRPDHVETRTVVTYREQQPAGFLPQPYLRGCLRSMLGYVLQRLQAAEVHRSLDVLGVPADAVSGHGDGDRGPVRGGAQGLGQSTPSQQWRINPVR